ncbi:hypothetical protein E2C01_062798 [Portunus trituberculatus]|uniref:Uncharacterized protein n=1 Tax=Portunus trituberculatus TaxID=210409 RepID=A0A5B7HF21_PORTR|nr:hypothetical protein [Portunus trituberculatus]
MDDNIPLNKFLGHVESERVLLLKTHASVNSVPSPQAENISQSPSCSCSQNSDRLKLDTFPSTKSEDRWSEITARLDQLQQQINKSTPSRVPSAPHKFCAFCQTETHFLKDCWRKPDRGYCFDCLMYGCHRGNPTCPGKAARTPISRANFNKKSSLPFTSSTSDRNTQLAAGTTNVSVRDPTQMNYAQ